MKYAAKMLVERRSGNVRLLTVGKVPDGTAPYRKYLSPGVSELLQVFASKENAENAHRMTAMAEAWRLESPETRLKAMQSAINRVTRLSVPVTLLSRLIGEKRVSIDAYARGRSPVPPRIVAKVTVAADKLEQLSIYLRDILPN